jgi:hypothetical protein
VLSYALECLSQPFVLDWLERHDLDNLWDGVHFIGAFQFVADAVNVDISATASERRDAEAETANADDMESRLKEAFLKNADNNSKVAVGGSLLLTQSERL